MLRYLVLIILIVLAFLLIVNLIFTKLLKSSTFYSTKASKGQNQGNDILYQDEEIIVLSGESKQKEKKEDE